MLGRVLYFVVIAVVTSVISSAVADLSEGERIYRHCKTCHGANGQGGEDGKYPRIARLPKDYIVRQLSQFKTRKRLNKPMLPIFKDRRFNADAMESVATYVSQMPEVDVAEPYSPPPEVLVDFDSREEFDELGQDLYGSTCEQCHGKDGQGLPEKETPPLINRYPAYIKRQISDFVAGRRHHEHSKKMFGELYQEEIESLLVYLDRLGRG